MSYPYTRATLHPFERNRARYSLLMRDVEKVNSLCEALTTIRKGEPVPTDGDRIICISPSEGQVSDRGYLERRENRIMICVHPSSAHVDTFEQGDQKGQIFTTASGGSWTQYMSLEQFLQQANFVGLSKAMFWTWGTQDANGTSGISFEAAVFLWQFHSIVDL